MAISTLLVDDSQTFLSAITQFLARLPEVKVVGQARNGSEALVLARELSPDLVLLDIVMPGMDGLQVARQMRTWPAAPRIVFLSVQDSAIYRDAVRELGIAAFVDKANFVMELLPVIRSLAPAQPKPDAAPTALAPAA